MFFISTGRELNAVTLCICYNFMVRIKIVMLVTSQLEKLKYLDGVEIWGIQMDIRSNGIVYVWKRTKFFNFMHIFEFIFVLQISKWYFNYKTSITFWLRNRSRPLSLVQYNFSGKFRKKNKVYNLYSCRERGNLEVFRGFGEKSVKMLGLVAISSNLSWASRIFSLRH